MTIRPTDKCHWFGRTFKEFTPLVLPFAGKPIVYCEVGVWRGDSAVWMVENVLTNLKSFGVGIDDYAADTKRESNEEAKHIAYDRLKEYLNWQFIFKRSQDALRDWKRLVGDLKIDILYLDGSHFAHDVVMDWCFAWPHLTKGSLVIFDDYGVSCRKKDGIDRVDKAVQSIQNSFAKFIEPRGKCYMQYAFEVVREPLVGVIT